MRRYFVAFLLCLLANISFAQKEDFPKPDVVAEFPGGQESMMQFIHKNLKYPKDCEKEGINGNIKRYPYIARLPINPTFFFILVLHLHYSVISFRNEFS